MKNTVYNFNGSSITFLSGDGNVMVNATEMAKPFGKRPVDWMQNQNTKEYLNELTKVRNLTLADLVQVAKGGNNPGTWMHEDVALEFSRWLSPSFAIWCNDRIKELIRYGMTATDTTIESILNDPDTAIRLLTELKSSREAQAQLTEQNNRLNQRTKFVDAVFETDGLIPMSQVAKVLQLEKGRNTLFKTLREKGILFKGSNEPKQAYVSKGYFKLKEKFVPRENHPPLVIMQTYVTQLGLAFIAKSIGVVVPEPPKTVLLN